MPEDDEIEDPHELLEKLSKPLDIEAMTPKEAAEFIKAILDPNADGTLAHMQIQRTESIPRSLVALAKKAGREPIMKSSSDDNLLEKIQVFATDASLLPLDLSVEIAALIALSPVLEKYFASFQQSEKEQALHAEAKLTVEQLLASFEELIKANIKH